MFLLALNCIFLSVIIILFIKVWLLKKDIMEICEGLSEHLSSETNTLIATSSGDKHIKRLVKELNKQLRILHKQRHHYINGSRELNEAITNITHDLRTPLTAICGYLELLGQEETSLDAQKYVEIIKNRTDVLRQLTEELFQYSVMITTTHHDKIDSVIVNDVLEANIAAFYAILTARKITPNIQLTENKIIRNLDRNALSRVFSNLLNNAIQYGKGDIDIRLLETGEIIFTNTASELSKVQISKLFKRFYTVDVGCSGNGLGLAIVRTLVDQMNGEIYINYENNRFSAHILLPNN